MQRIYTTCLMLSYLFAGNLVSYAQDWKPISTDPGYYAWQLDGEDDFRFIRVDSASQNGMTSYFRLNNRTVECDTCSPPTLACFYDPSMPIFRNDEPHFLNKVIQSTDAAFYHLSDTGSVSLWATAGEGQSWVWDTLANVTATVHRIEQTQVWGYTDSVKFIILSTNDTVVLAKSLGFLQYPDAYGASRYYRLKGIQSAKLGLPMPTAREIFDLEVGDRFEVQIYQAEYSKYMDIIRQYEIMTKSVSPEGYRYTVSGRQTVEGYDPYGEVPERTGPYSDELIYPAGADHFLNDAYDGVHPEVADNGFGLTEFPGKYVANGKWGLPEIQYGQTGWGYCYNPQHESVLVGAAMDGFSVQYLMGLGEVFYSISQQDYAISRNVTAWQRGSTTYGSFSPDSIFVDGSIPPVPTLPTEYSLEQNFPNPASDITKIPFDLADETRVTMDLFDLNGRPVERILDNLTLPASHYDWEYDVSRLASGWYYYRMEMAGRVLVKKMLVARK